MQKIDTQDGLFHDGNPIDGELGTIVPANWLNNVQNELVALVEEQGATLDANAKSQIAQLLFKTQPQFDNSRKLATTEYVKRAGPSFAGQINISTSTVLTATVHAGMFINVTHSVAAVTLTLPIASTVPTGNCLYIQNTTNYTTTITRQSSNLIYAMASGIQSLALQPGDSALLESDGSNWYASGTGTLSTGESFKSSLASIGYQRLPSGLYFQWGNLTAGSGTVVTYPLAFSTPPYQLSVTPTTALSGDPNIHVVNVTNITSTNFKAFMSYTSNGGGGWYPDTYTLSWFAIGTV